jgi:hypothetical protein
VLQVIEEQPRSADAQGSIDSSRFMQCRFPAAHYEWLRFRAFYGRTSMNSIVLEAIEELRAASPDAAGYVPLNMKLAVAKPDSVKFNVHLSDAMYEWLRTKAFNSRGSINQLLIRALTDHRARVEGSSPGRAVLSAVMSKEKQAQH